MPVCSVSNVTLPHRVYEYSRVPRHCTDLAASWCWQVPLWQFVQWSGSEAAYRLTYKLKGESPCSSGLLKLCQITVFTICFAKSQVL